MRIRHLSGDRLEGTGATLLFLTLQIFLAACGQAESELTARIDAYFEPLAEAREFSGTVLSLEDASGVDVRIVTDQADAALAILEQRRSSSEVADAQWEALWSSVGYKRLAARQATFGNEKTQKRQKDFLGSDAALELLPRLRRAVDDWKAIDITAAAELAAAYTPPGLSLRATLFPVIKQHPNSFVFDLDSNPAIFMYVGEEQASEKLANTLAHELHHVGTSGCPQPADYETLSLSVKRVIDWLSGFGEGIAVLAAAGSPDIHPHASSPASEWAVWERDIAHFNNDLVRLEAFFQSILDGVGTEDTQREQLFSFINTDEVPQGAFYTVGWKMAALIERAHGREVLVAAICDPRQLLARYNAVAAENPRNAGTGLARWSPAFLQALEGLKGSPGRE